MISYYATAKVHVGVEALQRLVQDEEAFAQSQGRGFEINAALFREALHEIVANLLATETALTDNH